MFRFAKKVYRKLFVKPVKEQTNEEADKIIDDFAKNDILVLTPDFPSNEYKYVDNIAFKKVKGFIQKGLKIDVIVANDFFTNNTYTYEFDGIKVLRTGYNGVRDLLLRKRYNKIILLSPVLTYYKILDAVNVMDKQVFLYNIENDITCDRVGVTDKYEIQELGDVARFNNRPNFKFVFENEEQKEIFEKANNIKLNNFVIPKDIDDDVKQIKEFNDVEKIDIPTISKKPLLSISIASYNVSKFIIQILCSLLRSKYADKLEILVVNDGSKDDTVKTVQDFIDNNFHAKGKPVVRLIDKPNGGHGSTINKGLELATGKYFRLLDGDDYFVTEELDKFLELLEKEDSDLIFTEYYEDYSINGEYKKTTIYNKLTAGKKYKFEELTAPGKELIDWGPLLHTSTYKTKLLQDLNFKIDEHCFYVDNEFNLMGTFVANIVKFYPLYIYSYYLGRPGQSVSPEGYKKNVKQLEKVCMRIIDEDKRRKDSLSEEKQNYIEKHMVVNLTYTMYWIVTELYKESGPFKEFDDKLKKYPELYNNPKFVTRRIKFYRKTGGKFRFLIKVIDRLHR